MAADWGSDTARYGEVGGRGAAISLSGVLFVFGLLCCGSWGPFRCLLWQLCRCAPTGILVLDLLVVLVCACLLLGVAQFELLDSSLSHLAARVLLAWRRDEAWLVLLPDAACSVHCEGEGWRPQKGGSWCRGFALHSPGPVGSSASCPWMAWRLWCLRSVKSYSLALLLYQKMESQEKQLFFPHGGLAKVHW